MGISTNRFLNKVVTGMGKIGNGCLERVCIALLYKTYAIFPPKHVKNAAQYYQNHKAETEQVKSLLADEESKEIYQKMIDFRSTYNMKKHPNYSLDDIYFIKGLVELTDKEVFVDAGAFDGDTIKKFLQHVRQYKRIIAFEPDKLNYEKMCTEFGNYGEKMVLRNTGVWCENTHLSFQAEGSEVSKILEENTTDSDTVKVEAIDALEACKDATYIKMDIEGAEMMALKGGKHTIINNYPKLAISIYHKDEDMIDIPLFIHSLCPEYKMYVRHHSHSFYDTVLYCMK